MIPGSLEIGLGVPSSVRGIFCGLDTRFTGSKNSDTSISSTLLRFFELCCGSGLVGGGGVDTGTELLLRGKNDFLRDGGLGPRLGETSVGDVVRTGDTERCGDVGRTTGVCAWACGGEGDLFTEPRSSILALEGVGDV